MKSRRRKAEQSNGVGMDMDIAGWGLPACFAALALCAWLAVISRRADAARELVRLCAEAIRLRGVQEDLRTAGRPAPFLDRARRLEAELRDLLRRRGLA